MIEILGLFWFWYWEVFLDVRGGGYISSFIYSGFRFVDLEF